jgi:hypothetical protein
MKHLRQTAVVGALAFAMVMPVFAETLPVTVTEKTTVDMADMAMVFQHDAQPIQVALMSPKEMKETEGAFVPLLYGGIVAANYAWTAFRVSGLALGAYRVIGPAYNGGRMVQVMTNNIPRFRLDNHTNPYTSNLHMHFGNMSYHRPWYAPWRKYRSFMMADS